MARLHGLPRRDLDSPVTTNLDVSTCGYADGDPKRPRTANSGFACRVDTVNGIWGFCPTTVIAASDCGLAGSCVDAHSCSSGCGAFDNTDVTTFTCTASNNDYCSTALLTAGPDQTYAYLACAPTASTQHLLAQFTTPTESPSSSTTSSSRKAIPSATSSSVTVISTSTFPTAAIATAQSVASKSSNRNTSDTGAIVGGVLGGLALLGLIVICLFFLRNHRARQLEKRGARQSLPWRVNNGQAYADDFNGFRPDPKKYATEGYQPVELSSERQSSPAELGARHSMAQFEDSRSRAYRDSTAK